MSEFEGSDIPSVIKEGASNGFRKRRRGLREGRARALGGDTCPHPHPVAAVNISSILHTAETSSFGALKTKEAGLEATQFLGTHSSQVELSILS